MGRGILQRLTFATRLLAVISSWSELERGAPEDSCRTRLSELQLLSPAHAPLHPHGLQQPRPAPHPFGGYLEAAVPSLAVLDLRNSCSLQIKNYVRGAHCSSWFLHLCGVHLAEAGMRLISSLC